jgi:hypothetical protein
VDDTPKMEEAEMTGGARKKSSSRKQRGGSDGHHTVETLDAMMGSEEQDMTSPTDTTSQTGGAKKRSGRKHKGGDLELGNGNATVAQPMNTSSANVVVNPRNELVKRRNKAQQNLNNATRALDDFNAKSSSTPENLNHVSSSNSGLSLFGGKKPSKKNPKKTTKKAPKKKTSHKKK